jgi:hypothetical protein
MARLLAAEGRYDETIANLNKVLLCEERRQQTNCLYRALPPSLKDVPLPFLLDKNYRMCTL